ncbi:hypothetical protein Tco_0225976 [Tanacetum coccineum]
MAYDVSWKSKLSTLNDENVLLKTQVDYVVKEIENNQDLLITISEHKNKLKTVDNGKNLVLRIVDSGCSKHMTGNLQLLRNFVEKFMGTVRFENDHFTGITGYGDYV